jgi:two-component system secretion system response regulator SalR
MESREGNNSLQNVTRYEREVLRLAADGFMDEEIADELSISERTVKEIQVNLMRKWNVHTISSAIDYALGSGFISIYEILEPRFRVRKMEVN